jgi:hypothetical protein
MRYHSPDGKEVGIKLFWYTCMDMYMNGWIIFVYSKYT